MTINKKLIANNLEVVYQRAINSQSDRIFFQSLFDYIEAFDQEPYLVKINKQIINLANQDLKTEKSLEKRVQKETLETYKEVLQYVTSHQTGSRTVEERLKNVSKAERGELNSSVGKTRQMYGDLTYALMILAQLNDKEHLNFCRKYGDIHDNASVANWDRVSTSFSDWEKECEKNKRIQESKVWHAWNEVAGFHNLLADYETYRDELYELGRYMELIAINDKFHAIKSAIAGEVSKKDLVFNIKRDEYQRYLDMVHQFIKQQLDKEDKTDGFNELNCKYDSNIGLLTIGEKDCKFLPRRIRGLILEMFFKNKQTRKKKLYWEDIFEKTEGNDTGALSAEQKRHRVYYAVRGINSTILNEFQIKDFFSYVDGYTSLNPQFYL